MSHPIKSALPCLAVLFCAVGQLVFAQGPGNENPRPPGRPPGPPVMRALDTDGNGELSAEEITNAAAALKTLDKNNDGKLDQSELRPNFGGGPGFGGPGPGFGGPGGPDGPGERGDSMSAKQQVDRYLSLDKNADGKLTKDEVPARMQGLFTRADANADGILTREELEQMVKKESAGNRNGGPGGFGGPPPRRDGGQPGENPGETRDAAGSPAPSPAALP
jgi:Ca2+-binding EF-hand superfamily protein